MDIDIHKHIEKLRTLLPLLRSGEIAAIEFGNRRPLDFMSHHRIQYIATHGPHLKQLCFKLISRRRLGSGNYMGDPDDRTIEIEAQRLLDHYYRPTPFGEKLKAMRAERNEVDERLQLEYFAVQHGEEE